MSLNAALLAAVEQLSATLDQHRRELDGLTDVGLRMDALATEIRTERGIAGDVVAALHKRIDEVHDDVKLILGALTMNGTGGTHG